MFELRWFTESGFLETSRIVLQYRTKTLKYNNWGEIIGVTEWLEWKPVLNVHYLDVEKEK